MMPDESEDAELNAAAIWRQPSAALTWALPQQQPFRRDDGRKKIELLFLPDENNKLILHRTHEDRAAQREQKPYIPINFLLQRIELDELPLGARISIWGQNDLLTSLQKQAEVQALSLRDAASRFTVACAPENTDGWCWHPALGFAKKK
jgi:CRISPR-associated endonuclease/helicase Cas3